MDISSLSHAWLNLDYCDYYSPEVDRFQKCLRLIVARDYGWLAGELFCIEGELGWGPGHRECEEDREYPLPTEDGSYHMLAFLDNLKLLQKDNEIINLIMLDGQKIENDPLKSYTFRACHARKANRTEIISRFYAKVATGRNPYTIGAARIYRSLWVDRNIYKIAVAGIIRLLLRPLTKLRANAETVKMRHSNLRADRVA